jgi:hypothetical protein
MGFMDWMLEKSEQKLFENVIEGLESIDSKIKYTIESLVCAENPSFTHLAIRAWVPKMKLYFHRCRNDWYFSEGTKGRDYLLLNGVDRFDRNLAVVQLHILIQAGSAEAFKEIENTSKSEHKQATPKKPSTKRELPELNVEEAYEMLLDLMTRSGSDHESASSYAQSLATDWKTNTLSALKTGGDEQIGTLWIEDASTNNKRASRIIKEMNDTRDRLAMDGVTDQEIVEWWNKPLAEQNLLKAESFALLHSGVQRRLAALDESVKTNRMQIAALQAMCTVPVFGESEIDKEGSIILGSRLPWELKDRVYTFFLSDVKANPRWEIEAIELKSYNAYFRTHSNG